MAAPYDTLDTVVKMVRSRLLDAVQSEDGDVFRDDDPGTILALNGGYRRMQEFLSKLGFQKFSGQVVLGGLNPVNSANPVTACRIDWAGYFNGAETQVDRALPADFICPIGLEERVSGNAVFIEMDDFSEQGIPLATKQPWNKSWEWRGDAIYLPGATAQTDIRLRYWSFAADFKPNATTPFTAQLVPIVRCADALTNFVCAEAARARGDMDGKSFTADGEAACMILVGRENPAAVAPPPTEGGQ